MSAPLVDLIRQRSQPLLPVPTDVHPRLDVTWGSDIRAVLFDVYGTMLISASGDVGTAGAMPSGEAFRQALAELGVQVRTDDTRNPLAETIRQQHLSAQQRGVDYPEVEIRQVWRQTLCHGDLPLQLAGSVAGGVTALDFTRLSLLYELRVNPVWLMPDLRETLSRLRERYQLGIISNAQFFTPLYFPAFLDDQLEQLGFSTALNHFSYKYGVAKPSPHLFNKALDRLESEGISVEQTVYIGNDMRNDIAPAKRLGCRTVLFAGDQRSLRLRTDEGMVVGVTPDAVITELPQLVKLLGH